MHWGLTAFERKRIERIALDHPYFDMHAQLLTKEELRTILAQDPRKTGPQVISEVKKELGMDCSPDEQEKRTFAEALHDASFVPSFRRMIVLGVLSLLLVLFMTLTIPGRAFAEEVYSIIIDLIDGTLGARNISFYDNDDKIIDFSSLTLDYTTPKELSNHLDHPIIAANDELVQFEYDIITSEFMTTTTQYKLEEDTYYEITQDFYGPSTSWGAGNNAQINSVIVETTFGVQVFINQSSDGTLYAIGFGDNYSFRITCSDSISFESLTDIIEKLIKIQR